MLYLAGKTGRSLPEGTAARYEVLQGLMFQMGGVGPMLGQAHHFRIDAPEKIAYAVDRCTNEAKRLYGVMDRRLQQSRYIGGPEYTIAVVEIFPWLRSWQNQGIDWAHYPRLKNWFEEISDRPAVQRAGGSFEVSTHPRHKGRRPDVAAQGRLGLFQGDLADGLVQLR